MRLVTDLPTVANRSDPAEVRRDAALLAIDLLPPRRQRSSSGQTGTRNEGGGTRSSGTGTLYVQLKSLIHSKASAGSICSSLWAELSANKEALSVVTNLTQDELFSIKNVRLLTDSRSGLCSCCKGVPAARPLHWQLRCGCASLAEGLHWVSGTGYLGICTALGYPALGIWQRRPGRK